MLNWSDLNNIKFNIKSTENTSQQSEFNTKEIDDIFEPTIKFTVLDKTDTCTKCNQKMLLFNNIIKCKQCGKELPNLTHTDENMSISASTNCNVDSKGYSSFKMTGKGSKRNQKSMLKSCATYTNYRKLTTLRHMNNWNNKNIEDPKGIFIPKHVIIQANEEFDKIKRHKCVYRSEGKDGVLSALLYYACYTNNITKTPAEIARFSGIEEKFHSLGDRILHRLHEQGIIEIPVKIYPIPDYVDRYMDLLDINRMYRQFIIDLIARAEAKKIHVLHDSKATTRVIGAIYMLITRIPSLSHITKEKIETVCDISKSTFLRYYSTIWTFYKKFKKVFKYHRIPMPAAWRKTKESDTDITPVISNKKVRAPRKKKTVIKNTEIKPRKKRQSKKDKNTKENTKENTIANTISNTKEKTKEKTN